MGKNKKLQQQQTSPANFLSSPTGKGIVAAGVVALAGLLFSKDKRAQGARDSIRGAADKMRSSVGNAFGSSQSTTGTAGTATSMTGQSSGDGITAH